MSGNVVNLDGTPYEPPVIDRDSDVCSLIARLMGDIAVMRHVLVIYRDKDGDEYIDATDMTSDTMKALASNLFTLINDGSGTIYFEEDDDEETNDS